MPMPVESVVSPIVENGTVKQAVKSVASDISKGKSPEAVLDYMNNNASTVLGKVSSLRNDLSGLLFSSGSIDEHELILDLEYNDMGRIDSIIEILKQESVNNDAGNYAIECLNFFKECTGFNGVRDLSNFPPPFRKIYISMRNASCAALKPEQSKLSESELKQWMKCGRTMMDAIRNGELASRGYTMDICF